MELSDINPDLMIELDRLKAEHKRDHYAMSVALKAISILIIDNNYSNMRSQKAWKEREKTPHPKRERNESETLLLPIMQTAIWI